MWLFALKRLDNDITSIFIVQIIFVFEDPWLLVLAAFFVPSKQLLNRVQQDVLTHLGSSCLLQPLGRKARQESGRFKSEQDVSLSRNAINNNRFFLNFHRFREIQIIFRCSGKQVRLCTLFLHFFSPYQFRRTIMLRTINFLIAIYGNNFFLEFVTHRLPIDP